MENTLLDTHLFKIFVKGKSFFTGLPILIAQIVKNYFPLQTFFLMFVKTYFYATDRSRAVVPVLFLFCVALWFILRGASCFKVSSCSLSSCFVIPFSI